MTTEDISQEQHHATSSALFIPSGVRTWSSFSERIGSLLAAKDTHVYIDTSFLMWLTKIGTPSRKEIFAWLDQTVPNRVHVPVWAAHEYLKHHTSKTLINDFTARCKDIRSFARSIYGELRPFIDEPIGQRAEDPTTLRTDMRNALTELESLFDRASNWTKEYPRHANETIAFINSHTPQSSSVYTDLETIGNYADSRLMGSVPPGFKDLRKSRATAQRNESVGDRSDANTYGDLLLWKEILNHASSVEADAIIFITNDLKNDWRMGRDKDENPRDAELLAIRTSWKPVPRPHPMLLFEARTQADIRRLELIDNVYLGAYLKKVAAHVTPAFIDVALASDQTNDHPSPLQPPSSSGANTEPEPSFTPNTADDEPLFSDPPNVHNTKPTLRRALLRSRQALDKPSENLLGVWLHPSPTPFKRIDQTHLTDVNQIQLTGAARALHDGVLLQEPGYSEALADIAAALRRLPPNTGAAIYLGFLASMYLNKTHNDPRFPPRSPIAKRLFELQDSKFARHAVTVIARHLHRGHERPIYIPTTDPRPVIFTLDTESNRTPPDQLASIRMDTQEQGIPAFPVELLEPVRTRDSLHLATIFDQVTSIDALSVIEYASEIYAFPTSSIQGVDSPNKTYIIPDALSFRDPREIRIQMERRDATE